MKNLILSAILMSSSFSWAVAPSKEMSQVVRALVRNPNISVELKSNNITDLIGYEISEVSSGVNKYNLSFERGECECSAAFAQVEIIEDMTPTYRDGVPVYTSSVVYSK
jgi:hypothetical protein